MSDLLLHVIILAAGEGKRMKSDKPKVLMPLAGRPMLAHVLETAQALKPAKIHIVYGHKGEQVRDAFADQADLIWVHQEQQRGTGHATQLALANIPDASRVLVMYGDVPLLRATTLKPLIKGNSSSTLSPIARNGGEGWGEGENAQASHTDETSKLIALVTELADPSGYGRVLLDHQDQVQGIIEEKDATIEQRAIRQVNTGILAAGAKHLKTWVANLKTNNAQGELYLTDIFAQATAAGSPGFAVMCADPMEAFGANDAWQLAKLERHLQKRQARELTMQGVRFADPARFDQRGQVTVGLDVEIDVDVLLEGQVTLYDGVKIGPFCRIKDSSLAAGTLVHAHCDLEGVITHGPCSIGPFARLRPGTELEAGVHIGNFVETKKARFGKGAKANHLTYLGDAEIGAAVNIGAGTITCNYDGVNKHITVIEDGAFIGSNSSLVAPLQIGKNATIGAGSVITKDAPDDQLTVTRAKQTTLPGWKRAK